MQNTGTAQPTPSHFDHLITLIEAQADLDESNALSVQVIARGVPEPARGQLLDLAAQLRRTAQWRRRLLAEVPNGPDSPAMVPCVLAVA
jgi:hypothetical protein